MKKLVLTGAAGRLGSYLREPLSKLAVELTSTDIVEYIGTLYQGERYVKANLESLDAMTDVCKGADMVVHFGAIGDEAPFDKILGPNIIGAYNVCSIHAVGMYPKNEFIGVDVPHRPDTFYGLAKCFAEDLGRMYWEKRGIESIHLRILSCAKVTNARALGSWLSYDDLVHLVARCIETPVSGFAIIYGVSNNDRAPVDNSKASFIGFCPKDNAEHFAKDILANAPPMDPQNLNHMCHGGPFAGVELGNSGIATMNIVNDKKLD
jgi:uronate dehydrogenase